MLIPSLLHIASIFVPAHLSHLEPGLAEVDGQSSVLHYYYYYYLLLLLTITTNSTIIQHHTESLADHKLTLPPSPPVMPTQGLTGGGEGESNSLRSMSG